jgi:hypothetical protein
MRRHLPLIATGLLLLAGCGQVAAQRAASPSATPPPAESGITGRVLTTGGPVSADYPITTRPYPMSKVTVTDAAGKVVAAATPKHNGTYTIDLPPGRYTATATPTSGNPYFMPAQVTVRAGHYTKADLVAHVP